MAILDVLTPTSEVNRRIQQPFHQMLRESGHTMMDITCFFEELPLPNFGMVSSIFFSRDWYLPLIVADRRYALGNT